MLQYRLSPDIFKLLPPKYPADSLCCSIKFLLAWICGLFFSRPQRLDDVFLPLKSALFLLFLLFFFLFLWSRMPWASAVCCRRPMNRSMSSKQWLRMVWRKCKPCETCSDIERSVYFNNVTVTLHFSKNFYLIGLNSQFKIAKKLIAEVNLLFCVDMKNTIDILKAAPLINHFHSDHNLHPDRCHFISVVKAHTNTYHFSLCVQLRRQLWVSDGVVLWAEGKITAV